MIASYFFINIETLRLIVAKKFFSKEFGSFKLVNSVSYIFGKNIIF